MGLDVTLPEIVEVLPPDTTVVFVSHGTDPDFPRPITPPGVVVIWGGTVEPLNSIDGDWWGTPIV